MYTVQFYLIALVSCLYLPADESYYKNKVNFHKQIIFLPVGLKWKDVKGVHCTLLLMNTGLISLSSC